MHPGGPLPVEWRWQKFSRDIASLEKKYYDVGINWHSIPPVFQRMYIVWIAPRTSDCEKDFVVEGVDDRTKFPAVIEDLYSLHNRRDVAKTRISQDLTKEAEVELEHGERLIWSVDAKLNQLRIEVSEYERFYYKAAENLSTSAAHNREMGERRERWLDALPEVSKARQLGIQDKNTDAYEFLAAPEMVDHMVDETTDEDTDSDTSSDISE